MTNTASCSEFIPDYLVHPGQLLEEELEVKNLKQSDLAKRTGLTSKTINTIIKGTASISPDTAIALEAVLGRPAVYWLTLEAAYQVRKASEEQNKILNDEVDLLDNIDVTDLIKQKWIKKYEDRVQQLRELLSYFGVATVRQLPEVWSKLEVNYRSSQAYRRNHFNIMAWLRRGEILAQDITCKPYSSKKFKEALLECRKLTNNSFQDVSDKITSVCSNAGVAVVFVPEISKISTSGAAQWLSKDKALIQLSLRGKKDDRFWFSFYHEAGHILLHGRKEQFIDNGGNSKVLSHAYLTPELKLIEAEADDFAVSFLIPKKKFSEFIARNDFSSSRVKEFSEELGIAPGIVVGQLQNNGFVSWGSKLNKFKKSYDFE